MSTLTWGAIALRLATWALAFTGAFYLVERYDRYAALVGIGMCVVGCVVGWLVKAEEDVVVVRGKPATGKAVADLPHEETHATFEHAHRQRQDVYDAVAEGTFSGMAEAYQTAASGIRSVMETTEDDQLHPWKKMHELLTAIDEKHAYAKEAAEAYRRIRRERRESQRGMG